MSMSHPDSFPDHLLHPCPSHPTLRFLWFFVFLLSPSSPVCAAQLDLWLGPAVVYDQQLLKGHIIKENWHSISQELSNAEHSSGSNRTSYVPTFCSTVRFRVLSMWSLWRSRAFCHNCHEFIHASTLLCLENTVPLASSATPGLLHATSKIPKPWEQECGMNVQFRSEHSPALFSLWIFVSNRVKPVTYPAQPCEWKKWLV